MRISDILKLKWTDVYTKGGHLRKSYDLKEKKTGKTKTVYFNEAVAAAFEEYLNTVPMVDYTSDEFVFKNKSGEQLGDESVNRLMKLLMKECRIEDNLSTHTMRKTAAYWTYRNTNNLALVQKLLNHRSSAETLRYICIDQEQMEEAYCTLNL